jgi:hypothetical protein
MSIYEKDEDLRAKECPNCLSNSHVQPMLNFSFSTCCGQLVCENCLTTRHHGNRKLACVKCLKVGSIKDYCLEDWETQQYKKRAEICGRVGKYFVATFDDFAHGGQADPTLEVKNDEARLKYNDYLELMQTIIYGLNSLIPEDSKEAENLLDEFSKRSDTKLLLLKKEKMKLKLYHQQFSLSTSTTTSDVPVTGGEDKKNQNSRQTSLSTHPVALLELMSQPVPKRIPSLHRVRVLQSLFDDKSITIPNSIDWHFLKEIIRMANHYGKIAGGWKEEYDQERAAQELSCFF